MPARSTLEICLSALPITCSLAGKSSAFRYVSSGCVDPACTRCCYELNGKPHTRCANTSKVLFSVRDLQNRRSRRAESTSRLKQFVRWSASQVNDVPFLYYGHRSEGFRLHGRSLDAVLEMPWLLESIRDDSARSSYCSASDRSTPTERGGRAHNKTSPSHSRCGGSSVRLRSIAESARTDGRSALLIAPSAFLSTATSVVDCCNSCTEFYCGESQ